MDMQEWAGPAWGELTEAQQRALDDLGDEVADRYPDDDDQPLRDAALSAAVQYWLGETTLDDAGHELRRARQAEAEARAAARQLAILAAADAVPETQIAARLGVDRQPVRKWLGKH